MPTTLQIAPARPGLLVRQPSGAALPADGAAVEWGAYWQRRLADGDIVVLPAAPAAASKARATAKED